MSERSDMTTRENRRICDVVALVSFPGYEFIVDWWGDNADCFVSVRYVEPDVMTGMNEEQRGRKWLIPPGQTAGQIVQTCFKALLTSLEHRAREWFAYKGKAVFQPHWDIETLVAAAPGVDYQDRTFGLKEGK
jgi:hypothetical protein